MQSIISLDQPTIHNALQIPRINRDHFNDYLKQTEKNIFVHKGKTIITLQFNTGTYNEMITLILEWD